MADRRPDQPDTRRRTFGQWWDSTEPFVQVSISEVDALCRAAYESVGASPADAAYLTATNLDKAIQGDHARGVGRVAGLINAIRNGKLDVRADIRVVHEKGATAVVDGGEQASGRLVARNAMLLAIDKAREFGVGFVGARGTAEILTPLVKLAVDAQMVGMAMVQSVPTVAPLGGYEPLLGNAPMAWGVPARDRDPVILDMAFTQSSASPVMMAAEQGQTIEPGLLLDEHGNPTTDASDFPDWELTNKTGNTGVAVKGSLVPLGNSHKGFAMVFLIGLLSSILTETSPPWELYHHLPKRGRYGTLCMAIDPSALDPSGHALDRVDAFCDRITNAPRREGVDAILYPGLRSQQLKRERRAADVFAIPRSHHESLAALAREIGHPVPNAIAS
jgi:LDH2 family malate/lactate/ureidoglycolate dehydrogenase